MPIENHASSSWSVTQNLGQHAGAKRRRGGPVAGEEDSRLVAFVPQGAAIEYADATETAAPARRGARDSLDISVELAPGEAAVLAVRDKASGALSFHAATEQTRRGGGSGRAARRAARFRVPVQDTAVVRRGPVSKLLKLAVIKLKDALIDRVESLVIAKAGGVAEPLWWRKQGRSEGLFHVRPHDGELSLTPVAAGEIPAERSLLLIHGTFSHTAAAFKGLSTTAGAFFRAVQPIYGDRIFALDHFTVSRTPEQNARDLLSHLPDRTTTFDVITHSRGGLVLRELCERPERLGGAAQRFALGRGVLVAAPNRGTPLATPARWQQTLGLIANLLEMFPDNPWTTGADFVTSGLLWLAKHIVGDLPGLASMDRDGATIEELQAAGGPATGSYSTLGASYDGDQQVWQRLFDAGVGTFFEGANDLVVPAEGSWLVDQAGTVVPAERIACFGPGGNLQASVDVAHHMNLFKQTPTIDFLLNALGAGGRAAPPLDPDTRLPVRKLFRGAAPLGAPSAVTPELRREPPPLPSAALVAAASRADDYATDTLQIMILGPLELPQTQAARSDRDPGLMILATYGSARVLEPFPTRDPRKPRDARERPASGQADAEVVLTPGKRFQKIIATQERIHACLDGNLANDLTVPKLPSAEELILFGELLFEALFVGGVRRLYDVARSEQRDCALNIVFTCTVPWLAALPWEFASDPERKKFLTTEEIHFIRNVLTPVPAQTIVKRRDALRILVVSAQPPATVKLDLDDEKERLKHGFHSLIAAGLAQVDVLTDTTAARLHDRIQSRDIEGQRYDVVHFIGHAEFDEEAEAGKLLFISSDGGQQQIDVRTLREILCGRGIHLVFLNACDTARQGRQYTRRNRGVAQALVEGGLPGVVANQYKVLDTAAVAFSERFYWSIALGVSLGQAAREARIAVNYSLDGEVIDWAVPVLYARDPSIRLCARWEGAVPSPTRSTDASTQAALRAVAERSAESPELPPLRVGIADMARYFSGLPEVVARMNSAQKRFVFQIVRVVAPLGVWAWRRDHGSESGPSKKRVPGPEPRVRADAEQIRYLVANRLAERLEARRRLLGVDFLACVTDRRLLAEEKHGQVTEDIYGWWSGERALPVMIFSTWDLGLPASGELAGRVIANHMATGLAAQLLQSYGEVDCMHTHGPKTCPFYYNEERDVAHISGAVAFDAACRKKLRSHLPKRLNPESLLAAFDALFGAFEPIATPKAQGKVSSRGRPRIGG